MDSTREDVYKWIDTYPITRQKKNIHRDFSDSSGGVNYSKIFEYCMKTIFSASGRNTQNSLSEIGGDAQLFGAKLDRSEIGQLAHFEQEGFEEVGAGVERGRDAESGEGRAGEYREIAARGEEENRFKERETV